MSKINYLTIHDRDGNEFTLVINSHNVAKIIFETENKEDGLREFGLCIAEQAKQEMMDNLSFINRWIDKRKGQERRD